jgi:8-oxo-dGTP pyrophosphatase MutT (NUDIX family)
MAFDRPFQVGVAESNHVRSLRERVGTALLLLPSVVSFVIDDRHRVLLAHLAEWDRWVAPGGSVEPGECPADAAVRETWEETGVLTRPSRIVGVFGGPDYVFTYRNGDRVAYVVTVFESELIGGSASPDDRETRAAAFFAQHQLPENVAPWVQDSLRLVHGPHHTAAFTPSTWRPPARALRFPAAPSSG